MKRFLLAASTALLLTACDVGMDPAMDTLDMLASQAEMAQQIASRACAPGGGGARKGTARWSRVTCASERRWCWR